MKIVVGRRVDRYWGLPKTAEIDDSMRRIGSMSFGSKSSGFVVLGSLVLATSNAGTTWLYRGLTPPTGFCGASVRCVGDRCCWVACASCGLPEPGAFPLLRSDDAGERWGVAWVGEPNARYFSRKHMYFVDEHTGWLVATSFADGVDRGWLFGTTDGGVSWETWGEWPGVLATRVYSR